MFFALIRPLHKLPIIATVGLTLLITGCGSGGAKPAGGEAAQGKMTPEEVQKELQKLSPPAPVKGKAKSK